MRIKTKQDYSCGVIPVRVVDGVREFLLVQHNAGHWAFPKGHPEGGETPIETARRELLEETGLAEVELLASPVFEEHYEFTKRSGTLVQKRVTYFLGQIGGSEKTADGGVRLQAEEVQAFAWGDAAATAERLSFDEGRALLAKVTAFLDAPGDPFGL